MQDVYRALGSGKVRKGSWLKFFCGLACLVGKYKEAKAVAPDSEQNTNVSSSCTAASVLPSEQLMHTCWSGLPGSLV